MATDYVWKVEPGSKVKLKDYDPDDTPGESKRDDAEKQIEELGEEISESQELLAAAQHQSMLIILQGMDTSGKDGTIRHVFSHINPLGCYVHSFKEPTEEDLAHDFLWRVHKYTPGKGSTGEAPWYIVPANHKWYRNLAISHVIAHTMRRYKDEWQADLEERGKLELAKLNQVKT